MREQKKWYKMRMQKNTPTPGVDVFIPGTILKEALDKSPIEIKEGTVLMVRRMATSTKDRKSAKIVLEIKRREDIPDYELDD